MSRGTSAPSAAYQKIKARGFIFFPGRYVIANRSNWEPPCFLHLNVHDRQFSTTFENFDPFAKNYQPNCHFCIGKGSMPLEVMMQIASDPAGGIAPGGHALMENVFAMGQPLAPLLNCSKHNHTFIIYIEFV